MKFKNSYFSYFMMYLFYYLSMALFTVLISVYLLNMGFKSMDVSLVVSMSFIFSTLAQPFIGHLSDRLDHKKVNISLLLISGVAAIGFLFSKQIISIAIFYSIGSLVLSGVNPVVERMAITSSFRYGSIRIWGTIGYATGSQLAGFIYDYISPQAIYIGFVVSVLLCALGIYGTQQVKETVVKVDSTENKKGSLKTFMSNHIFLTYLVISGIFGGVSSVAWTYIPAMLVNNGLSVNLSSTIIFVATLFELPLVFFSHKFMNRFSNKALLMMILIILIVQYAAYSLIPILAVKIVATLLCKHVAGMLFTMVNLKIIATIIGSEFQIGALALVGTIRSLSSLAFQNLGGYVIQTTSYEIFYLTLMAFAILALIITFFYKLPKGNESGMFE